MKLPFTIHLNGTATVEPVSKSATVTMNYNVPRYLADTPCIVTPYQVWTSGSNSYLMSLQGITQPQTNDINQTTQNMVSTRIGISLPTNDNPGFYGIMSSGNQQFTVILTSLDASNTDTNVSFNLSLKFVPL